ncbi:hypothetical protein Rcae01_01335 [Novipirellula caenicola]|uniref:Uncharacterized protein n=1 Tax=Novipirellula caenicola TaxID=1536901 RepID=A0ABP9VM77_9BACT
MEWSLLTLPVSWGGRSFSKLHYRLVVAEVVKTFGGLPERTRTLTRVPLPY